MSSLVQEQEVGALVLQADNVVILHESEQTLNLGQAVHELGAQCEECI